MLTCRFCGKNFARWELVEFGILDEDSQLPDSQVDICLDCLAEMDDPLEYEDWPEEPFTNS